ncbi:MAG: GGDEF domain-containing protein [Sutterellaceae bacterium]|nr:GGDEF domain-containing protein [Burkholderiaceae bacterium]MCX7901106.1 GGDEF domain-containing protein [Burkholderiaceae bacterium]MDW8428978.1 GGDEF domain-containing protein [Sutterellaceae bacterium]
MESAGQRGLVAAAVFAAATCALLALVALAIAPRLTAQEAGALVQALWAAVLLVVCATASLIFAAWRALALQRARLGQLDRLAYEDALTGLVNRRRLNELLPIELARAQRLGYPLSVAMIDFDHFKRFNDRHGHPAGDALLRTAAQAWRRQLRPTDVLARYGGEEFTLVLPACDAQQAVQTIQRLRALMPERQTFSAGVAAWNGLDSAEELLRAADRALLAAKRGGRNRTMVAAAQRQMPLPLQTA